MNIYSPLNPSALFMIQRRQRLIQRIFAESFPDGVENVKLLEIGCGNGQWLAEFATFGFRFQNLAGIELDKERAAIARDRIIGAEIREGNAAELPWPDESFDIVFQSTVFTSVSDSGVREKIASEMKRVCRRSGFILWYDFIYDNPKNPNVHGIPRNAVKQLFSPWKCEFRSVTLAPFINRKTTPISWLASEMMETFLPFLRTHLIAQIRP